MVELESILLSYRMRIPRKTTSPGNQMTHLVGFLVIPASTSVV